MTIGKRYFRLPTALSLLLTLAWAAGAHGQTSIPQAQIGPRLNLSQVVDKLVEMNAERADALQK